MSEPQPPDVAVPSWVSDQDRPRPPLWVIFAITMTGISGNMLIIPSLPEIVHGVGGTPGQAGLVLGAGTLPGIVLAPVMGLLADRYGRREVLVPCLMLFAASGGLAAAAPSLEILVVMRLLQGIGSAGLINLAVVIIGDHWTGASRAALIGRNWAVLTTCVALFPLLGGVLTDFAGWQAPFLVYPTASLTAVAVWRTLLQGERPGVTLVDQLRAMTRVLGQPNVAGAIAAGGVTSALIFGLLLTVVPLQLEQAFGMSASGRGLLIGLSAVANTMVALSAGRLQPFGRRRLLAAGCVLLMLSLTAAATAPTLTLLAAALVVFGTGAGLMNPNLQDIAVGGVGARSRGGVVALFVSAQRAGQTIGPMLAGWGLAAFRAPLTFAGGAAVSAALLVLLLWVSRRHRA